MTRFSKVIQPSLMSPPALDVVLPCNTRASPSGRWATRNFGVQKLGIVRSEPESLRQAEAVSRQCKTLVAGHDLAALIHSPPNGCTGSVELGKPAGPNRCGRRRNCWFRRGRVRWNGRGILNVRGIRDSDCAGGDATVFDTTSFPGHAGVRGVTVLNGPPICHCYDNVPSSLSKPPELQRRRWSMLMVAPSICCFAGPPSRQIAPSCCTDRTTLAWGLPPPV